MTDRIRVLHVLPHARALGGTERTVLDLIQSPYLADLDQRVVFVQPGRVLGFAGAHLLGGRYGFAAALPAIRRWSPQIIHGWLLQGNVAGAALLHLLAEPASLVTSERNTGVHQTPRIKRALERLVARSERVATANSAAVRDAAVRRVPRRAGVFRVITPGVDAPELIDAPRPTTVVMVGRLHPIKDHATALRAWRCVVDARPQATLTIVGKGSERERLETLARELKIESTVTFRGDADPAADLYGANMFLLSSRTEGFSRASLEALAVGLPIISTDVGGIDAIDRAAVRVAPVGNYRALAAHMLAWLNDPVEMETAATAARKAASDFSCAACHDQYRSLYRELSDRS